LGLQENSKARLQDLSGIM